jgi:hypothetical protein
VTTESKTRVAEDARPQCSTRDASSSDTAITPPANAAQVQRGVSEDSERAVQVAPTRCDLAQRRAVAVLAALVVMCLVMAVIVWWRLLT